MESETKKLRAAARALYTPGPTAAELELWGLTEEEGTLSADVWPENLQAVNVMISMSTQWRTAGMAGVAIGLDYGVLPSVLRMSGVPRAQWHSIFDDIRILEDAALQTMRINRG